MLENVWLLEMIFLNAFGNQNKITGDSLPQTVDLTSVRMRALHLLITYWNNPN